MRSTSAPLLAALLASLTALGAPATSRAEVPPRVTFAAARTTLDNGLELLVEEAHRAPLVAIQISYRVGAADDPPGRRGMARLVRDLLADPSTRHVARKVVPEMFHALGVEHWPTIVDVTLDRTTLTLVVPANELELALWVHSDQMGFGIDGMDQPAITAKRDGIEAQRQNEAEHVAYGAVPGALRAALYPEAHPYRAGVSGSPGDLASITAAELRAFVREHYAPSNATLVLVGDLEAARAKELAQKYFGPSPKAAPVTRATATPVTLDAEKRVRLEAHVDHARVVLAWPSPALFTDGDPALDAAYHLLGDAHRGRLVRRLVTEGRLATDVSARQRSSALGSQFEIEATVAEGKKPEEVLAAIDEELEKLKATPLPDAELALVQKELLRNTAWSGETLQGRAAQLGYFQHHKGDPAFVNTYLASYAALTPSEVQRVAAAVLSSKKRVVAIVTPNGAAPRGGRTVGGGS